LHQLAEHERQAGGGQDLGAGAEVAQVAGRNLGAAANVGVAAGIHANRRDGDQLGEAIGEFPALCRDGSAQA
jgi:hypothetical protein